jgi:cytochrome d ubiquinol oxidase subunit I
MLFLLFLYLLDKKIRQGPYDESIEDDRPLQSDIAGVISRK